MMAQRRSEQVLQSESSASTKVIYGIDSPYSMTQRIEVYGDPNMGWYEWRVVDQDGRVFQDTGTEYRRMGRQYGSPGTALRDALMVETGLEDPHQQEMRRATGAVLPENTKGAPLTPSYP